MTNKLIAFVVREVRESGNYPEIKMQCASQNIALILRADLWCFLSYASDK
jgi:hypothetical protein